MCIVKMVRRLIRIMLLAVFLPITLAAQLNFEQASSGGAFLQENCKPHIGKLFGAGDTIRTIPAPDYNIMGIEWVRDTLYVLRQATDSTLSATLYKLDPADGTVLVQFFLPFTGWILGLTFDDNNLWIVRWAPAMNIYKITTSGTFISSFPAPSLTPRGIAWDGNYLWIGDANSQTLYKVDTLGSVMDNVSMAGIIGWAMGMVWVPEHSMGQLWVNDDDYVGVNDDINQLLIFGGSANLIQDFSFPVTGFAVPEGICHDDEHLWVSEFDSNILWQVDDGIIEGIEEDVSTPQQMHSSLQFYPNPFNRSTVIHYILTDNTHVELTIYDIQGKMIRLLVRGLESAGNRTVIWNGMDNQGKGVASGIYFCQLKTASGIEQTKQLVLLR